MDESPTRNGVREIRLDSWREFYELNTELFSTGSTFIYRGQTNYDWQLESTLDRLESRYSTRKFLDEKRSRSLNCVPFTRKQHLRAFKNAIRGRRGPNPPPLNEADCWALGQHHGLATPLLDWTRSPFVALFFAFEEEQYFLPDGKCAEPEHRGVYILSINPFFKDPKDDLHVVRLVSPDADANNRLISQAALFIQMPRNTNLESYVKEHLKDRTSGATFTKIKISNNGRDECLVALNKMNINHMTLFPDIEGAAKHVNSLWQPGHEDSLPYV